MTHLTLLTRSRIGNATARRDAQRALGKPVSFFGLDLPPLIELNKQLGTQLKEIHEVVGVGGCFLIGTHALAAIFHHYVIKDNTFIRMSLKNLPSFASNVGSTKVRPGKFSPASRQTDREVSWRRSLASPADAVCKASRVCSRAKSDARFKSI